MWLGWYFAGQRKQRPEARRCCSCLGDKQAIRRVVVAGTGADKSGRVCGNWGEEVADWTSVGNSVETNGETGEFPSLSSINLDNP